MTRRVMEGVRGRTRRIVHVRARWSLRIGFLVGAACGLGIVPGLGGAGNPGTASAAGLRLAPLTTQGNHIMRLGVPFNFYGVNRDTLEWGQNNWGGCGGDGHFTATDFANIAAWHATAVRIPLSEANWLGRRCGTANYPALVDAAIAAANAQGMYAILDLHWTDVGGRAPCDQGCLSGQQPMPDSDSVRFWAQVAARYANRPGVIFDLFNEPHDVSWSCWRNGGCNVTASTAAPGTAAPVTYPAAGMQQLLNAVRATGARNLVLAAGLDWAYDLSGVVNGEALTGSNVAYDSHIYVRWHNTTTDWDSHVGIVARSRPVTVTELGSTDCSANVTATLLNYLQAPMGIAADRISWAVWSWNTPGDCTQPSLLANWQGAPLAGQGVLIHDTLAALAGTGAAPAVARIARAGRVSAAPAVARIARRQGASARPRRWRASRAGGARQRSTSAWRPAGTRTRTR